MSNRWRGIVLWLILVFLVGTPLLMACEPDLPLEIENQTDMVLTLYLKDNEIGNVGPNSSSKIKEIPGTLSEWQIVAKNSQGEVIFSRVFTFDELYESEIGRAHV